MTRCVRVYLSYIYTPNTPKQPIRSAPSGPVPALSGALYSLSRSTESEDGPLSPGQRHTSAVLFSEGLSLFSVPPHSRLSAPTRRNHLCFSSLGRQTALMPLALSPSPLPKVRINIYLSLCWTRFAPVLAFCPTEGRPNIACTPWRSVPAYSFYPWKYNAPLALFHSSAFLYSSAAYFTASLLTN